MLDSQSKWEYRLDSAEPLWCLGYLIYSSHSKTRKEIRRKSDRGLPVGIIQKIVLHGSGKFQ